MKVENYVIYIHTSPSHKVYIGITNQQPPSNRWNNGKGYPHNIYFTNAIIKYGWENFKTDILCTGLNGKDAQLTEIELIKQYKSNNRDYGYNILNGGGGRIGIPHTEETKLKMSSISIGVKKSKEHRLNISKALIVRFKDPLEREKMRQVRIGTIVSDETKKKLSDNRKGFKWNDETKLKMSESAIESWTIERKLKARKQVCQYELDGNYIRTFSGVRQAGLECNINASHISSCCKGKRKTIGGYIWRYKNE